MVATEFSFGWLQSQSCHVRLNSRKNVSGGGWPTDKRSTALLGLCWEFLSASKMKKGAQQGRDGGYVVVTRDSLMAAERRRLRIVCYWILCLGNPDERRIENVKEYVQEGASSLRA